MIDQDLVSYLAGLGSGADDRVYTGNAPQDAPKPYIVIRRTGGNTPKTLGNVSLFARALFSIFVIAKEYADAYPIANLVHDRLHGFRGVMGSTTVQSARCISDPADGSEIDGDKVTRALTQDYLIAH